MTFPYDPTLAKILETPPSTITEVLDTMRRMDEVIAESDGLHWFHWLYRKVTAAVADRVAERDFNDVAWMADLDVQFARLYFNSLAAHLAGLRAPRCWRALFDRRGNPLIARVQFALAGINAHINHDLASAIVATCEMYRLAPHEASRQYADYTAINGTLSELVEMAKRELGVRLLGDALPPVSHLEDTLAAWSIVAAREAAWTNAELLWDVREIPLVAGRYMDVMDGLATVAGKTMLVPIPVL
jgi:hypothetical protein